MHERCKMAAALITDLEKCEKRYPFACVLPKETPTPLKYDTELSNMSPLIVSDNNVLFSWQASKQRFSESVIGNPMKNITEPMGSLARNLKLDLAVISKKVAREDKTNEKKQIQDLENISRLSNHVQKQKSSRGIQTEEYDCVKCKNKALAKKEMRTRHCQTTQCVLEDATTQCGEEGGFTIHLDVHTLRERTFEQHHALEVFVKAFGLSCDFIKDSPKGNRFGHSAERSQERNPSEKRYTEDFDRMNFANPENPNFRAGFIRISPPPRSRSPSPKRVSRVFESVFERVGEKIPDSPENVSRFSNYSPNDFEGNRGGIRPYRIPTPESRSYRITSPGPSRIFRNRSRSRSRSRSPPRRGRFDGFYPDRRGRY